jgi:hypothetical protein
MLFIRHFLTNHIPQVTHTNFVLLRLIFLFFSYRVFRITLIPPPRRNLHTKLLAFLTLLFQNPLSPPPPWAPLTSPKLWSHSVTLVTPGHTVLSNQPEPFCLLHTPMHTLCPSSQCPGFDNGRWRRSNCAKRSRRYG